MTQQTTTTARHEHDSEMFPVLFENGLVRVYRNHMSEIFVEDIQSGATMRISSFRSLGGLKFTTASLVEPVQVEGMLGWRVGPR